MRLSAGTLLVIILFVMLTVVGFVAVRDYLAEKPVPPPPPEMEYAIAITDLPKDRVITKSDIGIVGASTLIGILEAQGEAGKPYLTTVLDDKGQPVMVNGRERHRLNLPSDVMSAAMVEQFIVGRRVKVDNIPASAPLQPSMFFSQGYRPPITEAVKDGRGVMTVNFTEFLPGDQDVRHLRADVVFRNRPITDMPGYDPIPEQTTVLVKNVEILEAGAPFYASGSAKRADGGGATEPQKILTPVTLAVDADAAAKLTAAQNYGDLMLVLYRTSPTQEISTIDDSGAAGLTVADLLQAKPTVAPAPEINIEPFSTMIFRGTQGFAPNSFNFSDLLRELQEVGAIEIKMDPKDNGKLVNPALVTVPLNQPSNTGQRQATGGNVAGGGDAPRTGAGAPADGPAANSGNRNTGGGGGGG